MSFIRAKEIPPHSGNWYDYEVMTIHEGKKVIQKVIRYIGKSSRTSGSMGVRPIHSDINTPKLFKPTESSRVLKKSVIC